MITSTKQLYSFFHDREKLGIKPGLERVNRLLEVMDHPEKSLQAVHVAGTNGKGSVIQLMQDALSANGYKVGVFTSPSFSGLTGHYVIDGKSVDVTMIIQYLNKLLPSIEAMDQQQLAPTSFEIITVIAFMIFANEVDIALIETGMGGRYDTTNIFKPLVSVITTIAMDHIQFLGDTIPEIAYHKAGIIKDNIPVVVGNVPAEALQVIQQEAMEKSAPMYQFAKDFQLNGNEYVWNNQEMKSFSLQSGLTGHHQLENAAVALSALYIIKNNGFNWQEKLVLHAFEQTRLAGRYEQVASSPFILLDSAHNMAGIHSFLHTMSNRDPSKHKKMLFAGFKDKNLASMLTTLIPHFETVTLTTFDHHRAASTASLQSFVKGCQVDMSEDWQDTVHQMLLDKSDENHYYITGSLHFITLVRDYIYTKIK